MALLGYCLTSLNFLCDILSSHPVKLSLSSTWLHKIAKEVAYKLWIPRNKVVDAKGRIFEHLGAVPHCDNTRVAADLVDDRSLAEGLQSAGFKSGTPSVFLAEGLIMYLFEGASWKGKVGTDQ